MSGSFRSFGDWLLARIEGVRDEDAQLALLFHWPLQRLLDVEALAHDGRVELAFERQQVHVSLAFGYEIAHLLREDFVG